MRRRNASAPTATTSGAEARPLRTERVRRLRGSILGWGEEHRRDLPWRRTRDPWRILVSEVMLQQTQVERVVPYYERFVAAFPTPGECAGAGSATVVRQWSGLGYNRRALNLHRAASAIVADHGGAVPCEDAALRALAGVGPYTARAVLTFAFERDVAVVDVNVSRVLSRAVAGGPLNPREAQELADRLLPSGRSWAWNQAVMEIGAALCGAKGPRCTACPLRTRCRWRTGGCAAPDPARAPGRQGRFEGSDRQGRGRLVAALRRGPVRPSELPAACGWPDDPDRARRVAHALVADGLSRRARGGTLVLP
jgi:A/G-specific adenine glycosylase